MITLYKFFNLFPAFNIMKEENWISNKTRKKQTELHKREMQRLNQRGLVGGADNTPIAPPAEG